MTKGLVKTDKHNGIQAWLDTLQGKLGQVATRHMDPQTLVRCVLGEMVRTPKLLDCTRQSLLLGLMLCSQLGLRPSSPLGHIYLLPYGRACTVILGYKGLILLAHRAGITRINADCFTDDFFDCGWIGTPYNQINTFRIRNIFQFKSEMSIL